MSPAGLPGPGGVSSAPASASAEKYSPLEKEILDVCRLSSSGCTDREIREKLSSEVTAVQRLEGYNRLLSRGRLEVVERIVESGDAPSSRVVVYKWVSARTAQRLAGLSTSERMAYDLIAKSKTNGQTRKEIKLKTNIQSSAEVKGILELLTARGLVKEIKSVAATNRRVYILAELEASQAHTGGPWYGDDQEFDQEFIGAVYEFAMNYITQEKVVTVESVADYVGKSGITNETLTPEDIRKLMLLMLHDAQVEMADPLDDGTECFSVAKSFPVALGHVNQPCCLCPVAKDCKPDGPISPQSCVYMEDWLSSALDQW